MLNRNCPRRRLARQTARLSKNRALLLGLLTLLSGGVPTYAAGLLQLADDAFSNDAKLASAEAAYRAGLEKEPEARGALLPHLSFTESTFRNTVNVPGQPAAGYSTVGSTLSLNQSVFKWDDWQIYQQSRLSVMASGLAFASAKQDATLRVSQAYFDALGAKDTFLLAQEHQRSVAEQLALTQRTFSLGAATVVDLDEGQAAADAAVADLAHAQGDLATRYAALQKIVGHPVDGLDPLNDDAALSLSISQPIENWVSDAETSGLDVRQQQIALEIARREISKVNAGFMPSISIVGNVSHGNAAFINGQTNFNTGANRATSGEVGIQISIPLFDGFSTTSRKREALALRDKADHDLEDARRSAALDAQQAFFGVRDGLAQVSALRTAQRSAETALRSNRKGFKVGVRINADVLNAEDKLFSTRRDLSKARYDTLMQFLHLKASVAQLDGTTLAQLVGSSDGQPEQPNK
ncbi:outer membrane protein [Paraburkholderia sp. RAU2J]|uniref:TolC family outer membrane protein n=1 Tax=Paraburkholderia sp. RAU2J TaxID=1938810 RepID=UPI000EB4BB68|nr:TolC family outer membrane protein [Paraburkholderia sp. RAU2J]RKT21636.1 outer membrane protein [Paraburkholderia sp. RAU2J]